VIFPISRRFALGSLTGELIMTKLRGNRVALAALAALLMSASALAEERAFEVTGTFAKGASCVSGSSDAVTGAGQLKQDLSDLANRPHLIEGHYIVVLSAQPGKKIHGPPPPLKQLQKKLVRSRVQRSTERTRMS
jgi:hypothetical protein